MVLYYKRVTFMAYFLKKTNNKKGTYLLIFRFIPVFTILNVVILLIKLINLLATFTNFKKKVLTILSHFTKMKLRNSTRNLKLPRMQKKPGRFLMILLKNSLAIFL